MALTINLQSNRVQSSDSDQEYAHQITKSAHHVPNNDEHQADGPKTQYDKKKSHHQLETI